MHDVEELEIMELVMPANEPLTASDAEEMLQFRIQEANFSSQKRSDELEENFHLKSLVKIIDLVQNAIDEAMNNDPVMTRCMHFKHVCDSALAIYEDLYKDYVRKSNKNASLTICPKMNKIYTLPQSKKYFFYYKTF